MMASAMTMRIGSLVKTTKGGYTTYLHGYRDSYNHRAANRFLWETVGQKASKLNQNNYANMHAFWRGMNYFRLSDSGAVFRKAEAVAEDYYQFITPDNDAMLGYLVDNRVMVLINADRQTNTFMNVNFPEGGNWKLIGTTDAINHTKGVKGPKKLRSVSGNSSMDIEMEATSLLIWVREE